ncbi:hypothetical protein [Prevotella aurantiaca]
MGFYPLHSTVLVQWNQAKSTRKYASEETKSAMARPVLNYFKTLFQYNNTPYIYNVTPKTKMCRFKPPITETKSNEQDATTLI